mmetsp:Transcript_115710/g.367959  ORF Transcript_115710/g.367959 Transcript_115710/m.367959 type:complete len:232 (-) Transcript_115710:1503-2198(-)
MARLAPVEYRLGHLVLPSALVALGAGAEGAAGGVAQEGLGPAHAPGAAAQGGALQIQSVRVEVLQVCAVAHRDVACNSRPQQLIDLILVDLVQRRGRLVHDGEPQPRRPQQQSREAESLPLASREHRVQVHGLVEVEPLQQIRYIDVSQRSPDLSIRGRRRRGGARDAAGREAAGIGGVLAQRAEAEIWLLGHEEALRRRAPLDAAPARGPEASDGPQQRGLPDATRATNQ